MGKNWEDVVTTVQGRLSRWRWLLPRMSYRGRVLVINNLVSSSLWHRMVCTDPPASLFSTVQRVLEGFFWDKLHWVPQSTLFLPREEGGQGLVHLASRGAAFRLQFLQRLLTGPTDLVWRPLSCCILRRLGGLGLDFSLFLMDPSRLDTASLPPFYQSVFSIWGRVRRQRERQQRASLHRLLQEPVLFGSILDCPGGGDSTFHRLLRTAGVLSLGQVVELTGPTMEEPAGLAAGLGLQSVTVVDQILQHWRVDWRSRSFPF